MSSIWKPGRDRWGRDKGRTTNRNMENFSYRRNRLSIKINSRYVPIHSSGIAKGS